MAVRRSGRRAAIRGLLAGLGATLAWSGPAHAIAVYFDGEAFPSSGVLGFDNSIYGFDIDLSTSEEWVTAADRSFNGVGGADPQFLVLIDTTAVWCGPEVESQCSDDFSIVDVTYTFELNENLTSESRDLTIILAGLGPSPTPDYSPGAIGIEFDPTAGDLEVVRYEPTGSTFLGKSFGDIEPGSLADPPTLSFRYRLEEPLIEMAPGSFQLPAIGVAAFAPVPEPSTALLVAGGLAALALRQRRAW